MSLKVLLVEDVDELRDTMRQAITLAGGMDVVAAVSDGASALAAIADAPPDAVVLDLGVPDLTGTELVARVRGALPKAHIVVFTGLVAIDRHGIIPRVDALVPKDRGMRYLVGLLTDLGRETGQFAAIALGPELHDIAIARQFLIDHCIRWGCYPALDQALLVMSELVTNAFEHAGVTCELQLRYRDDVLRLEVRDSGPGTPDLQAPGEDSEGGRGLRIVSALSQAWGVESEAARKVVWSEIALT